MVPDRAPRMHPLLLAFAAAAVLAVLAVRSWPSDLARHDRIHVALRHLREAEWTLTQGEPYRSEGLQMLARISDELGEYAREGGFDDPESFAADLRSYHECVTRMSLGAGPSSRMRIPFSWLRSSVHVPGSGPSKQAMPS